MSKKSAITELIKKMTPGKPQLPQNEPSVPIDYKPLSFWLRGNITVVGPMRINKDCLKKLSYLIVSELIHKIYFSPCFIESLVQHIYDALSKRKSYQFKNPYACIYQCDLECKRFTNIGAIEHVPPNFHRAISQSFVIIARDENRIEISYKLDFALGDNKPDIYYRLLRQGYSLLKLRDIQPSEISHAINNYSHQTDTYNPFTVALPIGIELQLVSSNTKKTLTLK